MFPRGEALSRGGAMKCTHLLFHFLWSPREGPGCPSIRKKGEMIKRSTAIPAYNEFTKITGDQEVLVGKEKEK